MNYKYDNTKNVLLNHVEEVLSSPADQFVSSCQYLIEYVQNNTLLKHAFKITPNNLAEIKQFVDDRVKDVLNCTDPYAKADLFERYRCNTPIIGYNRDEKMAINWEILRAIVNNHNGLTESGRSVLPALTMLYTVEFSQFFDQNQFYYECINFIKNKIVQDIYGYLDECIERGNSLTTLLSTYKHRSEWFRRDRLRSIAESDQFEGKKRREDKLLVDLHEYLCDQGVEFYVDPKSANGRPDLLLLIDGQKEVIDAKYVRDGSEESKIIQLISSGFCQVARYCFDFDIPFGYLLVYINSKIVLNIQTEQDKNGMDYMDARGKRIYLLQVDISDRETASKEIKNRELEISKEDITKAIENELKHPLN